MISPQERRICMLMMHAHDEIKKVTKLAGTKDLAEILGDPKLKWVNSKKCPQKHRLIFATAAGFMSGAAHALGVCSVEFIAQLLDEDENEEALLIGAVAKYAKSWRATSGK